MCYETKITPTDDHKLDLSLTFCGEPEPLAGHLYDVDLAIKLGQAYLNTAFALDGEVAGPNAFSWEQSGDRFQILFHGQPLTLLPHLFSERKLAYDLGHTLCVMAVHMQLHQAAKTAPILPEPVLNETA
jgi:hypothetical protein